jgi:electron transfer flavoprotein beta subunit
MVIAVLVKQVPDTASTFSIGADQKSVSLASPKFVMSPYDEHAVEEAIKIRDDKGGEAIAVSLGGESVKETIRTALAMGLDRAVLVNEDNASELGHLGIAQALAAAVKTLNADLVLAGKQAVDDDASQVPERVAEILELPHASIVTKITIGDGKLEAEREVEGGHYNLELPMPALLSIQKGINTPRYPTLPNIMKAKKKEIKDVTLDELGLNRDDLKSGLSIENMALPRQQRLNNMLEGEHADAVKQLVSALKETEKVL